MNFLVDFDFNFGWAIREKFDYPAAVASHSRHGIKRGQRLRCVMINNCINYKKSSNDFFFRTSEDGDGPSMDHLDFGGLFKYIPHLEEVHVTYGQVIAVVSVISY